MRLNDTPVSTLTDKAQHTYLALHASSLSFASDVLAMSAEVVA